MGALDTSYPPQMGSALLPSEPDYLLDTSVSETGPGHTSWRELLEDIPPSVKKMIPSKLFKKKIRENGLHVLEHDTIRVVISSYISSILGSFQCSGAGVRH